MMFLLGVTLTALAILYLLTTVVLGVTGHVRRPIPAAAALIVVLVVGVVLMAD
jgi:hypothetical protein